MILILMMVSSILFTVYLCRRKDPQSQTGINLGSSKVNYPQICSHQLLNAKEGHGDGELNTEDGSLSAMTFLFNAGIHCFDIDAVTTKDGILLATHPRRLAVATSQQLLVDNPNFYTLHEIREAGASANAFPELLSVINHYASLIRGQPPFYIEDAVDSNDGLTNSLHGPLLTLDWKFPSVVDDQQRQLLHERMKPIARNLIKLVHSLGIQRNFVLAVSVDSALWDLIQDVMNEQVDDSHQHHQKILLGLVLRDLVVEDRNLKRVQSVLERHSNSFRCVVPSLKFDPTWYQQLIAYDSELPITAWTVDTWQEYEHAMKMGVSSIIANHPFQIMNKIIQKGTD